MADDRDYDGGGRDGGEGFADRKLNDVVAAVVRESSPLLKRMLLDAFALHHSEHDCDLVVAAFADGLAGLLRRSHALAVALARSDLYAGRGTINMSAVIAALKQTESRASDPAHKARIANLAAHARLTYEGNRRAFGR